MHTASSSADTSYGQRAPTRIVLLVTHEHPDLDALLSLWLLRRFGEERYPGITQVPVQFFPAGVLPDDLPPEVLERDRGILAVDTGGGRLDTHSRAGVVDRARQNTCAAMLVAKDLGVASHPSLDKLLRFVTLQELEGRSIASHDPIDHLVALPNLVRGLHLLYPQAPERVLEQVFTLFDAMRVTEDEWTQALADASLGLRQVLADSGLMLLALQSDASAATRAARFLGADVVIHRSGAGATGITLRHNGLLAQCSLSSLAAALRVAEGLSAQGSEGASSGVFDDPFRLGMVGGWFLHDSFRILSRGSLKHTVQEPSKLELPVVLELAGAAFSGEGRVPESFCRVRRAEGSCEGCALAVVKLSGCVGLRQSKGLEQPGPIPLPYVKPDASVSRPSARKHPTRRGGR